MIPQLNLTRERKRAKKKRGGGRRCLFSRVNSSGEKDGKKEKREAGDVGTCLNVHECLAMLI